MSLESVFFRHSQNPHLVVLGQPVCTGVLGKVHRGVCFHPGSNSSSALIYLLQKALPDLPTPSAASSPHHSWPCRPSQSSSTAPNRHLVICGVGGWVGVCSMWVLQGDPPTWHRGRGVALGPAGPQWEAVLCCLRMGGPGQVA